VTRRDDDIAVVDVGRQLVVSNRSELKQAVLGELDRGARRVRLDFRETVYVDSPGFGVLVSLSRHVRERGGELRIANLNEDLATLFRLTKLDLLMPLDDDDGSAGAGVPAPVVIH
jgi:anti-sigma B factor antagonist